MKVTIFLKTMLVVFIAFLFFPFFRFDPGECVAYRTTGEKGYYIHYIFEKDLTGYTSCQTSSGKDYWYACYHHGFMYSKGTDMLSKRVRCPDYPKPKVNTNYQD